MNARLALFESLESRRLMSATCADVLAAEPSEPQPLLLPAVQKVREAAARMSAPEGDKGYLLTSISHSAAPDGMSSTLLVSEQLAPSGGAVTDGTSNTILYAERYS